MGKKVSELTLATEVGENDLLMIVQDGESKKIPASTFQLAGEAIATAETLNGYTDEDFVKTGEAAANSEKLGGIDADQYATKDYVDTRGGTVYADPTWCCPKMWFSGDTLPNNDSEHWHFCDGAALDPEAYPELFAVIGYEYTRTSDGTKATSGDFCLPDLNGRFVLGANLSGTRRTTINLPTDLMHGVDFTEHGQWIYPETAGRKGGDPTTVQFVKEQLATHRHPFTKPQIGTQGEAHSSAEYRVQGSETTAYTGYEGDNNGSLIPDSEVVYPYQECTLTRLDGNGVVSGIQGMLSMPPYLTFAWIMRIKP